MTLVTMKNRITLFALFLLLASALFVGCNKGGGAGGEKFFCPMHPTYISDRMGDCPICNMRLVPMEEEKGGESAPVAEGSSYTCPMHPEVKSDKPGRCPDCGMDLEPVEDVESATGEAAHSDTSRAETADSSGPKKIKFYRNPMDPSITSPVPMKDSMGMDYVPVYEDEAASKTGGVPGLAPITVSEEGLRLARVQSATAASEHLARTIRTVGFVTPDETRVRHIHTKIMGYIEKLYVNFTGQLVQEGSPILTLYSPELLASQQEYLTTKKSLEASRQPGESKRDDDLLEAARRRLELFDVPRQIIDELDKSGIPQRNVTLVAPITGFVTSKGTFEGQQVEPAMELFTITDLSHVWVEADFYEYEARFVRVGQKATLTLPYNDLPKFNTEVSYIYPTLNPETRTLRVRFDLPNPTLALKPAMYVDVDLEVESEVGVVIPDSAVMDTGVRKVVFVDLGGGKFEPREVRIGIREKGRAQILDGVKEGEKVVIHANFLLDSESRLRAAFSGMSGM